jgi:acyl carrier protein
MSTNTLTNTLADTLTNTSRIDEIQTTETASSADDRAARVIEIVCEHLEVDPGEIEETDLFVADHGADSLMLIGVLAALEKEFKITIDQGELVRMISIAGVHAVVAESAGW